MVRAELAAAKDVERRHERGWATLPNRTIRLETDDVIPHTGYWAPYHWATGSADVAPWECHEDGTRAVIDFKTMKSMDFQRQTPPAWAVDKWECQANIYMDWHNCDIAVFVGINKDSPHDMKEFIFTKNQPLIDTIYRKWELVAACLDEGVVPPEDEDIELPLQGPQP